MATSNPPRVMILADGSRSEMREAVERLRPTIARHLPIAQVVLDSHTEIGGNDAELAIVLGGDGSILRAAHQMGYEQRAVLVSRDAVPHQHEHALAAAGMKGGIELFAEAVAEFGQFHRKDGAQ